MMLSGLGPTRRAQITKTVVIYEVRCLVAV
jgi:hypothetical protein